MKKVIEIGGMGCMNCVKTVTEVLKKYEGVAEVVSVEVGKAVVVISDKFDPKELEVKLSAEDFDVVAVHGE